MSVDEMVMIKESEELEEVEELKHEMAAHEASPTQTKSR
jgi:hypothetical protein